MNYIFWLLSTIIATHSEAYLYNNIDYTLYTYYIIQYNKVYFIFLYKKKTIIINLLHEGGMYKYFTISIKHILYSI